MNKTHLNPEEIKTSFDMLRYVIDEFNYVPNYETTTSKSYDVIAKAEKFIKAYDPDNEKISRQQFMNFYRADDFHDHVTVDDCIEIFSQVMVGSSDFTVELLNNVLSDYCVDDIEVTKLKKYIVGYYIKNQPKCYKSCNSFAEAKGFMSALEINPECEAYKLEK